MSTTEGSLERESRLQRLKDNLIALQQRYAESIKSAQMGTSLQQHMGNLQSSVLSASMVKLHLLKLIHEHRTH